MKPLDHTIPEIICLAFTFFGIGVLMTVWLFGANL